MILKLPGSCFENRRYIYTVFMCHLAVEKALKGLCLQKVEETPPRTHNLIFLLEKLGLKLPDHLYDFVFSLNGVSVVTRYPDELKAMQKAYNKDKTWAILDDTKKVLKWLKAKLKK